MKLTKIFAFQLHVFLLILAIGLNIPTVTPAQNNGNWALQQQRVMQGQRAAQQAQQAQRAAQEAARLRQQQMIEQQRRQQALAAQQRAMREQQRVQREQQQALRAQREQQRLQREQQQSQRSQQQALRTQRQQLEAARQTRDQQAQQRQQTAQRQTTQSAQRQSALTAAQQQSIRSRLQQTQQTKQLEEARRRAQQALERRRAEEARKKAETTTVVSTQAQALTFSRNDLVYGPTANGALRSLQQKAGGKLLTDFSKPTEVSWRAFSINTLRDAAATGRQVHFDLTHMKDVKNILTNRGHFANNVTSHELRYIRDNWKTFQTKPRFYIDKREVKPPW